MSSTVTRREPTCDNCRCMAFRNDRLGEAHRYCGLFHNWIPDNEMFPLCGNHEFARKGGVQ